MWCGKPRVATQLWRVLSWPGPGRCSGNGRGWCEIFDDRVGGDAVISVIHGSYSCCVVVLGVCGGGCGAGGCVGMDGGAFLPVAMACATTSVVCGGGFAGDAVGSSSSTGMGGGAFLRMGLISMSPWLPHACSMILDVGEDALGGGERGCLLRGEGCLMDAGGNFAGTKVVQPWLQVDWCLVPPCRRKAP